LGRSIQDPSKRRISVTSVGELLSSRRKQRGNSIHDVERAIKIRAKYLEALEADEFEILPGDAYVVGFIKSYAEYLGIDPSGLIEAYRSEHQAPRLEVRQPLVSSWRERRSLPSLLAAGLLFLCVLSAVVWAAARIVGRVGSSSNPPAPQKRAAVIEATQTAEGKKPPRKRAAGAWRESFTLQLVATDSANWLAVRLDGRKVFDGNIGAGERRVWRVKKRIVIRSTTADVLRVYRDGRFVGKLGTGRELVERVYAVSGE